ncbi:MAG: hypothetical protein Q4E75_00365 [bacterium]|nr:hypothetical protein [bacterium]
MNDDFLLNGNNSSSALPSDSLTDLDSLFSNLSDDINNFNKFVDTVNQKKRVNADEERKIQDERARLEQDKIDLEKYFKAKESEYKKREKQIDDYLSDQKQNLLKAEAEFKTNMDSSLSEFEITRKELDIEKSKLEEDKNQFEKYKTIELNRLQNAREILNTEKEQFEQYKEVNSKKIELESKNIEQKYDKLRELISQFNLSFKQTDNEEE